MPLDENKKRILAIGGCIAALLLLGLVIVRSFGSGEAAAVSSRRTLIDSQTLEVFKDYAVPDGTTFPYENKKTGQKTLYPAEPCFWTKEGKAKFEPTWVLLNQYAGKPEPTICPDCGHKVTSHNKAPPGELFPQN